MKEDSVLNRPQFAVWAMGATKGHRRLLTIITVRKVKLEPGLLKLRGKKKETSTLNTTMFNEAISTHHKYMLLYTK